MFSLHSSWPFNFRVKESCVLNFPPFLSVQQTHLHSSVSFFTANGLNILGGSPFSNPLIAVMKGRIKQMVVELSGSQYSYCALSSAHFKLIQDHCVGSISTNPIDYADTIARLYSPQRKSKLTLVKQLAGKKWKENIARKRSNLQNPRQLKCNMCNSRGDIKC